MREVAVKHLLEHETFYANFFDSKKSFYTYISKIRRQSTYGDHFTLQALAREFNVQILVVSVTGPQYNTLISNTGIYAEEIPTLTLGYYHEERGEHYCSVEVAHAHLIRFLETFRTQTEESDVPNIQTSSTENIPASYQYEVDSHESPGTSFAADKCHTTAPDERDIITPSPAEGNENIHIDADFPSHVNVLLNPVKYGNCQFDAFAHQLTKIEINRTSEQLRQIAVKHLFKHRHFFGHFFPSMTSFHGYLKKMRNSSTYGDHFTLQALAAEFNVQVLVVSVLGSQHNTFVSRTDKYAEDIPTLTLGYYPEEHGEHYCSVEVANDHLTHFLEPFRTRTEDSYTNNAHASIFETNTEPTSDRGDSLPPVSPIATDDGHVATPEYYDEQVHVTGSGRMQTPTTANNSHAEQGLFQDDFGSCSLPPRDTGTYNPKNNKN